MKPIGGIIRKKRAVAVVFMHLLATLVDLSTSQYTALWNSNCCFDVVIDCNLPKNTASEGGGVCRGWGRNTKSKGGNPPHFCASFGPLVS
jgi:hypothetical protein